MAGVIGAREGAGPRRREAPARLAHPALPRWLSRADGELEALVELVLIAEEAVTPAEVDAAARALRVALPVHLAAEERAGGMTGMAAAVAPERAALIRQLVDEHDDLLELLAELDEDDEALRLEALHRLCTAILAHEHSESELLAAIADRVTSPVA